MSTRGRVLIAVAVVALLAGGLWWWTRPTPVAEGVVFVGDSVTVMSFGDLEHELGSRHPDVLARVGYRSSDLLPMFQDIVKLRTAAHKPLDQVVVLVGYNDVIKGPVRSPALAPMMDLADRFDCAVWLTLPNVPALEAKTEEWNALVREAAKTRPHVHVVEDWRRAVDGTKRGDLVNTTDGVHPTPAGAAKLVDVMQKAVGREC